MVITARYRALPMQGGSYFCFGVRKCTVARTAAANCVVMGGASGRPPAWTASGILICCAVSFAAGAAGFTMNCLSLWFPTNGMRLRSLKLQ